MSDFITRDGKQWTVSDIDRLENERDDYENRWKTLGRVAKNVIERQDQEIRALKARIRGSEP